MTDIQKAIKFAKSEIKSLELAPKINGCEMTEWWKEQIEIWKTAISALEKQIPKKPLNPCGRYFGKSKGGNCPCCGAHTSSMTNNYCRKCGQKLLWK